MLRSIIISPDTELSERLEAAITLSGEASVNRVLENYPPAIDLVRTLRAHAPDILFLNFESLEKAQEIVSFVEKDADGLQIIAFHRSCDAKILRESMRMGIREFISDPIDRAVLMDSINHVKALLERKPPTHGQTTQVFSFLPSKAGVGTSTLAMNVSAAIARRPNTRVLLSDFDLNSGMMRFLLNLRNEYSVIDAVEHSLHIDENLWPQLVTTMGQLDVLHAGRVNPNLRIEGTQIRSMVEFMRRNYDALCFDLSGNLEKYSMELMQESKRVMLVVTPEIPSLHLAREKLAFLRGFDLESRVSVVLNRVHKKPLFTKTQVEELLGLPVAHTFLNDYNAVNKAMTEGKWLDPETEMGRQFDTFAHSLIERRTSAKEPKRFLEFLSAPNRLLAPTRK
ncbi:MAG TPA: AAA family ATPase [Bryobacteraceae bacterium]|nr:AAA family ATPase [Bryobacteraceae bacterium]